MGILPRIPSRGNAKTHSSQKNCFQAWASTWGLFPTTHTLFSGYKSRRAHKDWGETQGLPSSCLMQGGWRRETIPFFTAHQKEPLHFFTALQKEPLQAKQNNGSKGWRRRRHKVCGFTQKMLLRIRESARTIIY